MAAQKSKAKQFADIAKKGKQSATDLAIEERLAGCGRKESEHIIYVGDLVERLLKGEFGAIIKALTAGRVSRELSQGGLNGLSADRILGRCEMANTLWDDLEQFVLDKDKAREPLQNEPAENYSYGYNP